MSRRSDGCSLLAIILEGRTLPEFWPISRVKCTKASLASRNTLEEKPHVAAWQST